MRLIVFQRYQLTSSLVFASVTQDRCHRIGQTRPVTVYRLVTQNTVDEDIYEMGERKRQLSQAVLSDSRSSNQQNTQQKGGKGKGGGKGSKKDGEGDTEDDMTMISRILSKALLRQGIQL